MKCEDAIQLDTEQDWKIFMNPMRQKIIRELEKQGHPMTAKQLANSLQMTPSSAMHHLKQLESIGIVELDHTEQINGITAKFFRRGKRTISIGVDKKDQLYPEREACMVKNLTEVCDGFYQCFKNVTNDQDQLHLAQEFGDVVTGIIHLSTKEAQEFFDLIHNFIDAHLDSKPDETHPWQFATILYRLDIPDRKEDEK